MRKYLWVASIGLQNLLVYRVNFFFRSVFGLIPLAATIALWKGVYAGKTGDIAGYTLSSLISYYLAVTLVDALTAVNEDDWQIAEEIREGRISQFLLKPIDYLSYRLTLFWTGRLVYTLVAAGPVAMFVFFLREYFLFPSHAATWGWFVLSLILTGLLQFFVSYTMALLAFWVLEVSTFIFMLFAFEYIAGGHLFPIDILPPLLAKVLFLTPFPYQMFFPASIYLERVTGAELYRGLLIQTMWVALTFALARYVWRRGIRKYSAFGG